MHNKCYKCNCKFTTNQSLKYHIKNNVCVKIKKKFSCMFCSKSYKYNHGLLKHLNNKHLNNKHVNRMKNNNNNNNKQNSLECKLCNKKFTRYDNLKRHAKISCKNNNNNNNNNNFNEIEIEKNT